MIHFVSILMHCVSILLIMIHFVSILMHCVSILLIIMHCVIYCSTVVASILMYTAMIILMGCTFAHATHSIVLINTIICSITCLLAQSLPVSANIC